MTTENCWLKGAIDEVDRTSKWSLVIMHAEDGVSYKRGFMPCLKNLSEIGWREGNFCVGTDVIAYQSAVNQGRDMLACV